MRVKVAYPDEWRTYENVTIGDSYAASVLSANIAEYKRDLARIDDDLANAALNDPKALEGLSRARTKAQADLDSAEQAWIDAEEALAETVS